MANIQTPFAHHKGRSSYDGSTPLNPAAPPLANTEKLNQPSVMLDDSFDNVLPPSPSLDDFLAAMTANVHQDPSKLPSGHLHSLPSRMLTLSNGKSLSAMASLDLSWLAEAPSMQQQQQQQGLNGGNHMQRKPSLAECLVGPEHLASKDSLPHPPALKVEMETAPSFPFPTTMMTSAEDPSTPPPSPGPNFTALQAAYAALLEAQNAYMAALTSAQNTSPELAAQQQQALVAAQQHLALQQSYFASLLQIQGQQQQQQVIADVHAAMMASAAQQGFQGAAVPPCFQVPGSGGSFAGNGGINIMVPGYGAMGAPGLVNPYLGSPNPFQCLYAPSTPPSSTATLSPTRARADAMAQWAQERALMQALNSSDMETAVQAMSGIMTVHGAGPQGVPQPCLSNGNGSGGGGGGGGGGARGPDGCSINVCISSRTAPNLCVSPGHAIKVSKHNEPKSSVKVENSSNSSDD